MYTQSDKLKANKSKSAAKRVTQKKKTEKQSFSFADNRSKPKTQSVIQNKIKDSKSIIQMGGQIGKMSRSMMPMDEPVKTGGMWLVETDAAKGFHQQVRIGPSYHLAYAVSFGYAGNGEAASGGGSSHPDAAPGGDGDGEVYIDHSRPTKQIQHCPMSAEQVVEATTILKSKVGETGEYDVLTKNCAHWSMKTYDEIKSKVKN